MESSRTYGKELAERPRATAQAALQPMRLPDTPLNATDRGLVGSVATQNGIISAIGAAAVSGAAVLIANRVSPQFRTYLGISGKAALVVTPTAGAFFLKSHLTIGEAHRDPQGFVSAQAAEETARRAHSSPQDRLSTWQTAANAVYNHPFKTIMGIAAPIYGALFYRESTHPATSHMPLSQRLIHTRVYGQMVAVLSTVSVMAFAKGMEGSGGVYRIDGGRLVRGVPTSRQWYEHSVAPAKAVASSSETESRSNMPDGHANKDGLDLMVPLLYAPLLPLMRILGRGRVPPERLNLMMLGTIGLALSHAGYIMFSDSTVLFKDDGR